MKPTFFALTLLPLLFGIQVGANESFIPNIEELKTCVRLAKGTPDLARLEHVLERYGRAEAALLENMLDTTYFYLGRLTPEQISLRKSFHGTSIQFVDSANSDSGVYLIKEVRRRLRVGHPVEVEYTLGLPKEGGTIHLEVLNTLRLAYGIYRDKGMLTDQEIQEFQATDRSLSLLRLSLVVKSRVDGTPLFIVRAFNGSRDIPFMRSTDPTEGVTRLFRSGDRSSPIMPLQKNHPDLKLAEDELRLELGRGARSNQVAFGDLHAIFRNIGVLILTTYAPEDQNKLFIYAEVLEPMLPFYTSRHGFTIVAGTKLPSYELNLSSDFQLLSRRSEEDRFILKIRADDFININHYSRMYSAP